MNHNTELIKTKNGYDFHDKGKVIHIDSNKAKESFPIFNSFTDDSCSRITKITFKKKTLT